MSTVIVTRSPVASNVVSGRQAFDIVGSSSVNAALADSNDGTYIQSGANVATASVQQVEVRFAPLNLPTGAVIEYIQPVVRERHGQGGHLTVASLHANNATGAHKTPFSLAATGANPADNVWRTTNGPIFQKASDGVEWSACDPATFAATIAWGPRWWDTYYSSIAVRPAISKLDLLVAYRLAPVCTINYPSAGSIADPRPTVSWGSSGQQEAYRVIVVASDATDGSGRTVASANFTPETVSAPAFDSGKVYSSLVEAVASQHLTPGATYHFFVRSWAPSIGSTEMPSAWASVGPVAVTAETVTPPSISVVEDDASYSVQVTVTREAPGTDETAPTYYSAQRWNGETAAWEAVTAAQRLSGPGPWSYFDSARAAGETVLYRARGVFITAASVEVPSAWVQDSVVVTNRGQWWLKDPTDHTLNMEIEVREHRETIPKPQEVAYGAGARGATVTHQGVRRSQHRVSVRTLNAATYTALRELVDSGRSLILCSVFGDAWRVQLGDGAEVEIIRAQPIDGETTPIRAARLVNMTFIEVER